MDMPAGTSLDKMTEVTQNVEKLLKKHPDVTLVVSMVGDSSGQTNVASIYVRLVEKRYRKNHMTTNKFKDIVRLELASWFSFANPKTTDPMGNFGGLRPFNVNVIGSDIPTLNKFLQDLWQS